MSNEANKPAATIRMGAIKATIWKNEADGQAFYSVVFVRSYKKGEDWKESDSFGRDDLLALSKLADLAHTQIFKIQDEARKAAEAAQSQSGGNR